MNRMVVPFVCEDSVLFGTLDLGAASGATGLLIVSGGGEIRAGSWGGQARLAARLANEGIPVFRFDRRGVGESCGTNPGFRALGPDIAAALTAFRAAAPHVKRIVAFGNCDGASALMLHAAAIGGIDALVLGNPWTLEEAGEDAGGEDGPQAGTPAHSAAALRRHYLRRLTDPRQWLRLARGAVDLKGLALGLRMAARPQPPSALAARLAAGLAAFEATCGGDALVLLAEGDRTAQLFRAHWPRGDTRILGHASASHSFADEAAREWLFARLLLACA